MDSRWTPTRVNNASISDSGLAARLPSSDAIPSTFDPAAPWSVKATVRCGEENSSPRINIGNTPLGFAHGLEVEAAEVRRSWPIPTIPPFNHGDSRRGKELLQTRSGDLRVVLEPVKVDMIKRSRPLV